MCIPRVTKTWPSRPSPRWSSGGRTAQGLRQTARRQFSGATAEQTTRPAHHTRQNLQDHETIHHNQKVGDDCGAGVTRPCRPRDTSRRGTRVFRTPSDGRPPPRPGGAALVPPTTARLTPTRRLGDGRPLRLAAVAAGSRTATSGWRRRDTAGDGRIPPESPTGGPGPLVVWVSGAPCPPAFGHCHHPHTLVRSRVTHPRRGMATTTK